MFCVSNFKRLGSSNHVAHLRSLANSKLAINLNDLKTTKQVVEWAKTIVDEKSAKVLEDQEISGETLLQLSPEELMSAGMKLGPAKKIIAALKKPDPSQEYWQNFRQTLKGISSKKVEWKGEPADPELSVLSLPNGFHWPTLESRHLFIRARYDCYERIWGAIETEYLKRLKQPDIVEFSRALIQGNSGIGKTAFLNYALFRALQKDYPVLLETKEIRVFFQGDKIEFEALIKGDLLKYHRDLNVLVLHDHQPQCEPPIITNGAFVVAPVSPDARNSKQFSREKCLVRWMPLPTSQELEAMNSLEPQLSFEDLHSRIDLFGPITRVCLSTSIGEHERYKKLLNSKLQSFRFKELSPMLRASTLPNTQEYGLSWWIIHLDAQPSLDCEIVSWGSTEIFDRVTRITDDKSLAELEDFLADQLRAPSPLISQPTKEYEIWIANKLAQGKELCLRYYSTDGILKPTEDNLVFTKDEVTRIRASTFDLSYLKKNPNKLFLSSTAPLCDIATNINDTLVLIQATVGRDHDIKLEGLKNVVNEAIKCGFNKIRLIYAVPEVKNFKFQPSQLNPALEFIKIYESVDIKIAIAEMKPQSIRPKFFYSNE